MNTIIAVVVQSNFSEELDSLGLFEQGRLKRAAILLCDPAALVEVSVYGDYLSGGCGIVTEQITAILNESLDIHKDRIYVKYHQALFWGCGGKNMD